jgi:hypothetical protein
MRTKRCRSRVAWIVEFNAAELSPFNQPPHAIPRIVDVEIASNDPLAKSMKRCLPLLRISQGKSDGAAFGRYPQGGLRQTDARVPVWKMPEII